MHSVRILILTSILSVGLSCLPVQSAVIVKDKMWPQNAQLIVLFLDGSDKQKALVKKYAPEWLANTSLTFKFHDDVESAPRKTHIRVSFKNSTGSMLGNHGEFSSSEPTLQLAKLALEDLPENYAKRLILHEFGHALGLEHEYRNPKWPYGNAAIEAQIKACFPNMLKLDYSDEEAKAKCKETNQILDKSLTISTVYDEYSIMNYPMTIKLKDQSSKKIPTRFELSVLDKLAIQRWYSK